MRRTIVVSSVFKGSAEQWKDLLGSPLEAYIEGLYGAVVDPCKIVSSVCK
jgi:hypothetical protein